ncbi:MAG: hypothetical protein ACRDJN_23230 [Chloroflexota bacterium]
MTQDIETWRTTAAARVGRLARRPVFVILLCEVMSLLILAAVLSRVPVNGRAIVTRGVTAYPPAVAGTAVPTPGAASPGVASPGVASPGAAPTAPAATAAPGAASVQTSTAPLRTVLDERFADNHRGWPNDPRSTAWLAGGGYRLYARHAGQFVAVGAPIAEPLRDVVVTATFRKVGGPSGGGYGVIVRDQGDRPLDGLNQIGRYYVLEVGDRGEFGIWRREGDRWLELVPWMPEAAVRAGGATNELQVVARGLQLLFVVNGTQVASHTDGALRQGAVGVFTSGEANDVLLERFVVRAPGDTS